MTAARVQGQAVFCRGTITEESFDVVLRDFSKLPAVPGSFELKTPEFSLCRHRWAVWVYTNGNRQESAGHLSAFLYNRGEAVTVSYSFQVFVGVAAAAVSVWSAQFVTHEFSPGSNWGYNKMVSRESLVSKAASAGDVVTVRVAVMAGEPSIELLSAPCGVLPVPEPTLVQDIAALFDPSGSAGNNGCDVVLRAGGREFKAHRFILAARSRVLRAMLFGGFRESASNGVVELTEEDASTAEILLHFFYTGIVSPSPTTLEGWAQLLAVADRLDVPELFGIAQSQLAALMTTPHAALACLALALRLTAATPLKTAALDMLVRDGVPETIDSSSADPELLIEVLRHAKLIR